MNLFEYQGKRLYQDFSIPTPKSIFVSSISEITVEFSNDIGTKYLDIEWAPIKFL